MNRDSPDIVLPQVSLHLEADFDLELLRLLVSNCKPSTHAKASVVLRADKGMADSNDCICHVMVHEDPPLTYEFEESKFYIRACYEVYYDLLVTCLNSGRYDYLTVMGTPGTGKSLFYIYVFNRIRAENPMVTVVVVTFDKRSRMNECWLYEPGKDREKLEVIPEIPGAIYLCDGPPSRTIKHVKMVLFTCPNHEWLRYIQKDHRHVCLGFPVWTLDELLEANDACELGLDKDMIVDRFNFFGGSARYCLSKCDEFVADGRQDIEHKITMIDTIDKLRRCLEHGNASEDQILHWAPRISSMYPFVFTVGDQFVCSKLVDAQIRDCIAQNTQASTQREFICMIRGHTTLSQVRGVMFENLSHARFSKGGTYELKALDDGVSNITVQLSAGAYEPAMKPGCESVDGVAVENDVVYLFQMTVSDTRAVNANGILERLKQLDRFDRFIHGSQKVCLVFVRPTDSREYKRQSIVTIERMDLASPVRRIPKMRSEWVAKLARENVYKIDELIQYAQTQNGEKYRGIIAAFMTRNFNAEFNDAVRAIPQYELKVAECDERDKSINDLSDEIRRLRAENERLQRILVERLGA